MTVTGHFSRAAGLVLVLGLMLAPALAQDTPAVDLMAPAPAAVAPQPPLVGTWRTLTGTEIAVQPCGNKFCGSFSYIVIPAREAANCRATPKDQFAALILDYANPDKSMQTRPLLGAQAMTLKPDDQPNAYTANIYNAEEGKNYDVLIRITGDTLILGAGCFGGMCAVTQEWPRVPNRATPDFTCEGGQ